MPLINSNLISNYYFIENPLNSRVRYLASSYRGIENQEFTAKTMFLGDNGTQVQTVGGHEYTTEINTPILIIEEPGFGLVDDNSRDRIGSMLSLLAYCIDIFRVRPRYLDSEPLFLLSNAQISLQGNSNSINAAFISSTGLAFKAYKADAAPNLIGRVAIPMDVHIGFASSILNLQMPILTGEIQIQPRITKNYISGLGQKPTYTISHYAITGSVVVTISPKQLDQLILAYGDSNMPLQIAGELRLILAPFNSPQTEIYIGNNDNMETLLLGNAAFVKTLTQSLTPNNLTTVALNFDNLIHRQSGLVYGNKRPSSGFSG